MVFSSTVILSTAVIVVPWGRQISWTLLKVGLANLILKIWEPAKRSHKQESKTKKTYGGPVHQVCIPKLVPRCIWLTAPDRRLSLDWTMNALRCRCQWGLSVILSIYERELWEEIFPDDLLYWGGHCSLIQSSQHSFKAFTLMIISVFLVKRS